MIRAIIDRLRTFWRLSVLTQIAVDQEMRSLRSEAARDTPGNPMTQGFKVYSQTDEDGIIEAIFSAVGCRSRIFVEIGASDGLENNTHYLLHKGWRGVWIEGSQKRVDRLRQSLERESSEERGTKEPDLCVASARIDRANVDATIASCLRRLENGACPSEIDLLSIDIDGNDLPVLEAVHCVRPRVICAEYNAKFPPPTCVQVEYDPELRWAGDDYMGASLSSWVKALSKRGYTLVSCNVSGSNAFFVDDEALRASALPVHAPSALYKPARYHLMFRHSGHRASLAYLARAKSVAFMPSGSIDAPTASPH